MEACPELEELEELVAGRSESAEVRSHVASCVACRHRSDEILAENRLLERIGEIGRAGSADGAPRAAPSAPPELDGYRVDAELHRGGQGIVFEGVQLSTQRKVALKVLLEGTLSTAQQLRRFEREIETVLRLRHPNVVTVYDRGVARDGRHFFAMEFVEGVPLDAFARERRAAGWDARAIVELFSKVCDAVSYAHQRGVIHRDLKPGNVLVDRAGEPRVLDFGLAKAAADETAAPVTVTRPGWFLGTLAYASPEQLRGDPDQVDVRTDVYSLGVMLFELLVGRLPYDVEGSMPDAVLAILESEPAFPRGRDAVDDELAAIVRRAMAKEREHRYQSAGDLARDLGHWLRGEAIDARRGRLGYLLRKTLRRHRVVAGAAALVLIVIVGASIFSTIAWRQAVRDAEQARIDYQTRARVTDMVESLLLSVEPDRAKGRAVTVREVLDEAAARLGIELAREPAIEAELRATIGKVYTALGLFDEAVREHEQALALERRLHPGGSDLEAKELLALADIAIERSEHAAADSFIRDAESVLQRIGASESLRMGTVRNERARLHFHAGEYDTAEQEHRAAVALYRRAGHPVEVAKSLADLSTALTERGKFTEAEASLREALAVRRGLGDPELLSTASTLRDLAHLLTRIEHYDEARTALEEALAIDRKLLGPDDLLSVADLADLAALVDDAEGALAAAELRREAKQRRPALEGQERVAAAYALHQLGSVARDAGDLDEAERELRASLELYTRLLGRDHPAALVAADHLAWTLYLRGRNADSERLARETLELRREHPGSDPFGQAGTMVFLAWATLRNGHYDEAEQLARESLELRSGVLGPDHGATCGSRNALGWILHQLGRDDEAEALVRENLERQVGRFGEEHAGVAQSHYTLAEILSALGRKEEAEQSYLRSIELRRDLLGESLDLATSLDSYGWFLLLQRRLDEAGPLLEEALEIRRKLVGDGHPQLCWSLNNLGAWHFYRGKLAEAEQLFTQAIEMARRVVPPGDPALAVWVGNLGKLKVQRNDLSAAEPLLLESLAILRRSRGPRDPKTLGVVEQLVSLYRATGRNERAAEIAAE